MAQQLALPFAFNPELVFEQYCAGTNGEAVGHLERAAESGSEPLIYLWGGEGTGKTHLLNACCRKAAMQGLSVSYVPLSLLRDYGPAVLDDLDSRDFVCLDDVDRIAGCDLWEGALFTLFNRLRETGRALIVSATLPPTDLPVDLPDLKTRLGWGLTLKLHPLSDDDKLVALEFHARALGLDLPPQVGRFLLARYRRDLPALRRLLDELDRASLAAKRRLTIPFLKAYLGETTEQS